MENNWIFFVWIISEIWWTKSWSFSWTHLFLVKWTWVNDLHHPSHPDDLEQHSLGDCALHKCKSSLLRAKASNITIIIFSSCSSIITIIYCLSSSRWSPSSPLIILLWLVILNNLNILVICGRCKRCLWCRISIFSPFLFPGSQALCRAAATFWPWDIAHFSLPHPLPTTHPPNTHHPFSASHHRIFLELFFSHPQLLSTLPIPLLLPSRLNKIGKFQTYFTIVNARSPLSAPRLWIKLCGIHFRRKFFQTRACKTSNKMEICNFFQIC